jgi:hypothetical protein
MGWVPFSLCRGRYNSAIPASQSPQTKLQKLDLFKFLELNSLGCNTYAEKCETMYTGSEEQGSNEKKSEKAIKLIDRFIDNASADLTFSQTDKSLSVEDKSFKLSLISDTDSQERFSEEVKVKDLETKNKELYKKIKRIMGASGSRTSWKQNLEITKDPNEENYMIKDKKSGLVFKLEVKKEGALPEKPQKKRAPLSGSHNCSRNVDRKEEIEHRDLINARTRRDLRKVRTRCNYSRKNIRKKSREVLERRNDDLGADSERFLDSSSREDRGRKDSGMVSASNFGERRGLVHVLGGVLGLGPTKGGISGADDKNPWKDVEKSWIEVQRDAKNLKLGGTLEGARRLLLGDSQISWVGLLGNQRAVESQLGVAGRFLSESLSTPYSRKEGEASHDGEASQAIVPGKGWYGYWEEVVSQQVGDSSPRHLFLSPPTES